MLLSYNEEQLVFACGLHALTSQFSDGSHAETLRMQMEFQRRCSSSARDGNGSYMHTEFVRVVDAMHMLLT